VAHIFLDPVTCLSVTVPSFTGSPKMREIETSVRHFSKTYVRDRNKPIKTVGITGLRENFGRDDGIEEPNRDPRYTVI